MKHPFYFIDKLLDWMLGFKTLSYEEWKEQVELTA